MNTNINPAQQMNTPLSEQELEALDDFLFSDMTSLYCMSLEAIDGFFCALAVTPQLILPSKWLPVIWGGEDETPNFESEAQASYIYGLLIRHWNTVNYLLQQNSPHSLDDEFYMPLMLEPDDDENDEDTDSDYGEEWAIGFRQGMVVNGALWERLFDKKDNPIIDWLSPIILLSEGHNPDYPEKKITLKERKELAAIMVPIAYQFFDYWHSPSETKTRRSETKVGRNEPCPCGSGKKYKKCCGNSISDTLH